MTGMRFDAYITSKMLAMSILCAVQSFFLTTVFSIMVGLPERGVFGFGAYLEILIATFLTALAASAMGILVSSLFKNADRAMTVAPLLLMPQLLFSGLIFELEGVSKIISVFAVCRWSMESYGTTANLNTLDTITKEGLRIAREYEVFFEFTRAHISFTWLMLCFYILAFSILAGCVLRKLSNEQ
jgi:ABC-type transport system involved in multi-copper enzyme maturation permease subunit